MYAPAVADPSIEELSGLLTSIARQTHSPRLYGEMGARSGVDIRPSLFGLLFRIRDMQPVRVTDVADEMDNDRSTISRRVAELATHGCVERHADPNDGRAVVLTVTPLGDKVITLVLDAWLDSLHQMTGGWSARDRKQLVSLLRRLDGALAEHFAVEG